MSRIVYETQCSFAPKYVIMSLTEPGWRDWYSIEVVSQPPLNKRDVAIYLNAEQITALRDALLKEFPLKAEYSLHDELDTPELGKVIDFCGCSIQSEFYPGKVTYDLCPLHANAEKLMDLVQRAVSLIGGLNYWLVRAYEALGAEPKLQDTVKDWLKDACKVLGEIKHE